MTTEVIYCDAKNKDCKDGNGHDFGNGERVGTLAMIFLDREVRETCVKCGCLLIMPPDPDANRPPKWGETNA